MCRVLLQVMLIAFAFVFSQQMPSLAQFEAGKQKSCLMDIPGVTKLSSEQLISLTKQENGYVILDIRNENEWDKEHIDSSINIPISQLTVQKLQDEARREDPVIIYCDSVNCEDSYQAINKIKSWGWQRIFFLDGGLIGWTHSGYPLIMRMK